MLTSSPFTHNDASVRKAMLKVQIAALPALAAHIYFFGYGIVIQFFLALITAVIVEAILLKLRNRPIKPFLTDGSSVITITGLVFCIPPEAPWWIIVSATLFALIFGKHLYGGLGYNPFNPAMLGFAFVLISFPAQMSLWSAANGSDTPNPTWQDSASLIFQGHANGVTLDQISGATPLGQLKSDLSQNIPLTESLQSGLFNTGWATSEAGLWISLAFFIGGIWLLWSRAIRWQYPVAFLGSLSLMALIFHQIDPDTYAPLSFHLFAGGTMLAAFYIITDPVTASTTPRGRLVFAASIGVLVYVIRNWGAFPDGIAFAILIMNMFVPLIDQYTQPRVFGYRK